MVWAVQFASASCSFPLGNGLAPGPLSLQPAAFVPFGGGLLSLPSRSISNPWSVGVVIWLQTFTGAAR